MGAVERNSSRLLAEFQLSTFAFNAELTSDSTVRAAAIFKSCSVFDRRRGKDSGITQ